MISKCKIWIGILSFLLLVVSIAYITHIILERRVQYSSVQTNMIPAQARGMGRGMFIRYLNLRNEQIVAYDEIRSGFFREVAPIDDSIQYLRNEFMRQLKAGRSPQELLIVTDVLARLETRRNQLTMEHFIKLYQICDPRQKQEFLKVLDDILLLKSSRGMGMRHRWGQRGRINR